MIQETIKDKFKNCTVLTIAHRLDTVMDNDRILVMDAGSIVEVGTPFQLLEKDGGFLKNLVDQTGTSSAMVLKQKALENSKLKKNN